MKNMYSDMTNETLYYHYTTSAGGDRMNVLSEMARRAGTYSAMLTENYRFDVGIRDMVDRDTVYIFRQYKLNGGQMDRW